MIKPEDVYKIGIINKPHGIHGEMLFTFEDDVFDRVDADYLVCDMDGILVPFFIESYRFKSDTAALLKFEDIDTAEQARKFTNTVVYFPKEHADELDPEELGWNYFIGFKIYDANHHELGTITEVENSTINTLFIIEREGKEVYIPAQEDFICEMDTQKRTIIMDLPEGLLEL